MTFVTFPTFSDLNVSGSYLLTHRGVRKNLWTVSSSIIWKWKVEGETWKGCGRWVETAYLPSPHTNVSIDITWDLRLPLNRFSSFQTYTCTCKMKTKRRQIWPPHQATKGPATPLSTLADNKTILKQYLQITVVSTVKNQTLYTAAVYIGLMSSVIWV